MIEKMNKETQNKIAQVVKKAKLPIQDKHLHWEFDPNVLIHFAEVKLIDTRMPDWPPIVLSIDKPSKQPNGYVVSGVHFYIKDFSKATVQFLLPIQSLVRQLNNTLKATP